MKLYNQNISFMASILKKNCHHPNPTPPNTPYTSMRYYNFSNKLSGIQLFYFRETVAVFNLTVIFFPDFRISLARRYLYVTNMCFIAKTRWKCDLYTPGWNISHIWETRCYKRKYCVSFLCLCSSQTCEKKLLPCSLLVLLFCSEFHKVA